MALIGEEGLDLAILPIGDYYTMGPDDAVRAVKLLKPRHVLPIHYNTFPPITQDADAWAERVKSETAPCPSSCSRGSGSRSSRARPAGTDGPVTVQGAASLATSSLQVASSGQRVEVRRTCRPSSGRNAASTRSRPACPRRRASSRIADDVADRPGQELGIADGDEDAGLAVDDDLGGPRRGGGDHGLAEPHGLEHEVRQALVGAGQDHEVGRGHQPGHVVAVAQEPHPAVEIDTSGAVSSSRGPERTVAGDQGAKVGLDVLEQVERLEQVVDPLLLRQPAGEQDQRRVGREAELGADRGAIDRRAAPRRSPSRSSPAGRRARPSCR